MDNRLLLFLSLAAALAVAIDAGWELARERRRVHRLVSGMAARREKGENQMLGLAGRLLGWYGHRSLPEQLARAGYPRLFGESQAHFYAAKLILALLAGLRLGGGGLSFLAYGQVGFMLPDGMLYLAARKRKEEILRALPEMLDFLHRALAGGAGMRETLAPLPLFLCYMLKERTSKPNVPYAVAILAGILLVQ